MQAPFRSIPFSNNISGIDEPMQWVMKLSTILIGRLAKIDQSALLQPFTS
jgi:hypothetical protein